MRGRLHRHVGGEHHGGLALQHCHVDDHRAGEHQREAGPRDARRSQPAVEQHRGCEVQNRHLEEDDPHQQHVESVRGQREVEPVRGQEVHRRPAGERHQQPEQSTDREEHHRGDRVRLDQVLRREVNLQSGGGAGAKCFGHRAPSSFLTVRRPVVAQCRCRARAFRAPLPRPSPSRTVSGQVSTHQPTRRRRVPVIRSRGSCRPSGDGRCRRTRCTPRCTRRRDPAGPSSPARSRGAPAR